MARKLRRTTEGIYHVTARAPVGELLFRDAHDFLRFEAEVQRVVSPSCVCIGACTLHTHYHLILQTEDGVLARVMKQVNQRYAGALNARYGRHGHAFAERSRRSGRATEAPSDQQPNSGVRSRCAGSDPKS
jgi:hypothetical protein